MFKLVASFSSCLLLAAADVSAALPASICVEVQMVSITPSAALTLVPLFGDEKSVAEAEQRVQRMISAGEATLLGWPRVWMKSGRESVAATAVEIRYPVEYDPPQVPSFGGQTNPIRPVWGESNATTFETRNAGPELKATATATADGRRIAVTVESAFVRLTGFNRFSKQTSNLGISGVVEQPRFENNKVQCELTVLSGRPVLLGVFAVPGPVARVQLHILKASSMPPYHPLHTVAK